MIYYIQSEVPITATDAAVDQVVKLLKELEPLCPSKVRKSLVCLQGAREVKINSKYILLNMTSTV
jgi:hypothetical protein